jgi:hypothetical protein
VTNDRNVLAANGATVPDVGDLTRGAIGGSPPRDAAEGNDSGFDTDLEPLTAVQIAAVEALASGVTVSNAARAANVPRDLLDDWLDNNASFVAELNALRRDRLDHVRSRLRNLADKAVATIESMLDDERVPAAVRLKIAQIVLNASGAISVAQTIGPCTARGAKRAIEKRKTDEWLDDLP